MIEPYSVTPGPYVWPDCHGNGIKYRDTNLCECFMCYSGPECNTFDGDACVIVDNWGNPLVNQEYWQFEAPANTTTTVSDAAYRSAYAIKSLVWGPGGVQSEDTGLASAMDTAIRRLHKVVGNVVTDNYFIVPANGATQLIGAAMYAISRTHGSKNVYAKAPFYGGYEENAEVIGGVRFCTREGACKNEDGTSVTDESDIIEFVTVPNNPDNSYRTPDYAKSHVVYDMAYNWPHLVTDQTPTSNFAGDIMLFTMSKLSGHGGTRFGWALVRDEAIANSMGKYISNTVTEVSHDALYRSLVLINHMTEHKDTFFPYIRTVMEARRDDLRKVFANVESFSMQSNPDSASFYLWLKCEVCYDESAKDFFANQTGIAVAGGDSFGMSKDYVRLHTVLRNHTWPLFLQRLSKLQ